MGSRSRGLSSTAAAVHCRIAVSAVHPSTAPHSSQLSCGCQLCLCIGVPMSIRAETQYRRFCNNGLFWKPLRCSPIAWSQVPVGDSGTKCGLISTNDLRLPRRRSPANARLCALRRATGPAACDCRPRWPPMYTPNAPRPLCYLHRCAP